MTLANRARQVADAAPRHQSAAVLRECADALDAKDADLAALRAVVRELPGHKHGIVGKVGCEKLFEGGPDWLVLKCICGADESNAALAAAKKMAGGE